MTSLLYKLLCVIVLFQTLLALDTLKVLVILPLNNSTVPSNRQRNQGSLELDSWERGTDLLREAKRAVVGINHDPNILHGYRLEVVPIDSMSCNPAHYGGSLLPPLINSTLHNDTQRQIISAVGIFCHSSAKLITKVVQHPSNSNRLKFPFIIGSMSPSVLRTNSSPNVFYMLNSSLPIVEAIVKFMEYQQWSRLAVITDLQDTYYSQTADTFLKYIKNSSNTGISISSYNRVQNHFQLTKSFDAKVVLVSASLGVSRKLIKAAFQTERTWPTHAWLFHTHSLDDLSNNMSTNTHFSGMFILESSLPDELHSYCNTNNLYANILCKSIRVSALMKNTSTLFNRNDYITALNKISSMGLADDLTFDESTHTLFASEVKISQTSSGKSSTVGYYESRLGNLIITDHSVKNDKIPPNIVYRSRSITILLIFYVEVVVCFILVTVDLILYIHLRKEPEVKATSFSVSIFIFLSCYLLILYLILLALEEQLPIPTKYSTAICLARSWLNLISFPGPLMVATMLLKMFRVYRIFDPNNLTRTGKCLSNRTIVFYILLLQIPNVLVALIWSIKDPYKNVITKIQRTNSIEVVDECNSEHLALWPGILLGYNVILVTALATFAYKTRKIRRVHFKDTKKMNAFVFLYTYLTPLVLLGWLLARALSMTTYSEVLLSIGHTQIIFQTQLMLFVPKLYPPLKRKAQKHTDRRGSAQTSSLSTGLSGSRGTEYSNLSNQSRRFSVVEHISQNSKV